MGKIRKWHFTHKANIENCNYESYLHKIAKTRIKAAFDENQHFFIEYEADVVCDNVYTCNLTNNNGCCTNHSVQFDLKNFYDTCLEEATFQSFRADLLLSSSQKKLAPILIEIFVTHKSTDEKIQSKARIIEIKIKDEESIDKICNSHTLCGNLYLKIPEHHRNNFPIVFYNFKLIYKKPYQFYNHRLGEFNYYLYMLPSGKYEKGKCYCYEDIENLIPKDADYIIGDYKFEDDWALSKLFEHGSSIKNCLICKFCKKDNLRSRCFCSYFKQRLYSNHALTCENFRKLLYEDSYRYFPERVKNIKYYVVIRKPLL